MQLKYKIYPIASLPRRRQLNDSLMFTGIGSISRNTPIYIRMRGMTRSNITETFLVRLLNCPIIDIFTPTTQARTHALYQILPMGLNVRGRFNWQAFIVFNWGSEQYIFPVFNVYRTRKTKKIAAVVLYTNIWEDKKEILKAGKCIGKNWLAGAL